MTWFGSIIKEKRIAAGWSRERLSLITGVDGSTIRRIEDGGEGARFLHVERLLKPFGSDVEILEENPQ